MKFLKVLSLILFLPFFVFAKIQLILWQSETSAPKIILARVEGETNQQAVQRYTQQVLKNKSLSEIAEPIKNLSLGRSEDLVAEKMSGKTRLAFIANWFQDMTPAGARIQRNIKTFSAAGADAYVIAVAADIGLNASDAAEFRSKISENFSLLVSLGGDDISPELYGQEKTFARNTNTVRDQSEFLLVKSFKKYARGIFFGICRGHQMGAIADGHKLFQDLSKTNSGTTDYHINLDGKNSTEMQTWHSIDIEKSLLTRFLKNSAELQVNSVHHQAVDLNSKGESLQIATDDKDQIVEALQGKNNKSLSVQFHPEFPLEISGNAQFSNEGFKIIKGIVSYARLTRQKTSLNSCQYLF